MEDSEIITLFLERKEEAVSAVDKKYGNYCRSIAMNILQNYQDCEECVNSAYLKLWNAIPPQKPDKLSAFAGRITRNSAIDLYRQRHSKKSGGEMELVYDELENYISDSRDPEEQVSEEQLIAAINKFLKKMPKKKRTIFVLRYSFCISVKDIAKKMNKTENSISVTLNRTRKELFNYLTKEGFSI